jgi:hypothetical protein
MRILSASARPFPRSLGRATDTASVLAGTVPDQRGTQTGGEPKVDAEHRLPSGQSPFLTQSLRQTCFPPLVTGR